MKIFARELLWFLLALVLAAPVAWLFSYSLGLEPTGPTISTEEEVFQMELFIIGYIVGIIGTYLMRLVIWAVQKVFILVES
jgi:hypothetical protein